jgi:hypothetical protein
VLCRFKHTPSSLGVAEGRHRPAVTLGRATRQADDPDREVGASAGERRAAPRPTPRCDHLGHEAAVAGAKISVATCVGVPHMGPRSERHWNTLFSPWLSDTQVGVGNQSTHAASANSSTAIVGHTQRNKRHHALPQCPIYSVVDQGGNHACVQAAPRPRTKAAPVRIYSRVATDVRASSPL